MGWWTCALERLPGRERPGAARGRTRRSPKPDRGGSSPGDTAPKCRSIIAGSISCSRTETVDPGHDETGRWAGGGRSGSGSVPGSRAGRYAASASDDRAAAARVPLPPGRRVPRRAPVGPLSSSSRKALRVPSRRSVSTSQVSSRMCGKAAFLRQSRTTRANSSSNCAGCPAVGTRPGSVRVRDTQESGVELSQGRLDVPGKQPARFLQVRAHPLVGGGAEFAGPAVLEDGERHEQDGGDRGDDQRPAVAQNRSSVRECAGQPWAAV